MPSSRKQTEGQLGRRRRWNVRTLIYGGVGLFILIQLIPVWLLQTNPSPHANPQWDSARTLQLVQKTCLDCHSTSTTWPWYSRVAPVSWLVTWDVLQGREALNFSNWGTGTYSGETAGEAVEAIQNGSMPPAQYLFLHRDAALSPLEKQQLIDGLQKSLR